MTYIHVTFAENGVTLNNTQIKQKVKLIVNPEIISFLKGNSLMEYNSNL